jgi:hypothetical protein
VAIIGDGRRRCDRWVVQSFRLSVSAAVEQITVREAKSQVTRWQINSRFEKGNVIHKSGRLSLIKSTLSAMVPYPYCN